MLIYIGIRFKFAFGVAAIFTLAHDVIITLGIGVWLTIRFIIN